MNAVSPELDAPQRRIAEDQPEYLPVTVALVTSPRFPSRPGVFNGVVMAFRPTEEERVRLAVGADVYVSLLTFGRPQQPIIVTAGKEDMAGAYGIAFTGAAGPPVEESPESKHRREQERYITGLLREIGRLSTALGDTDAWHEADASELNESFDPWHALRLAIERIAAAPLAMCEKERSAFIAGMDECREHYQAYSKWPSLPGRIEMAADAYPEPGEESAIP